MCHLDNVGDRVHPFSVLYMYLYTMCACRQNPTIVTTTPYPSFLLEVGHHQPHTQVSDHNEFIFVWDHGIVWYLTQLAGDLPGSTQTDLSRMMGAPVALTISVDSRNDLRRGIIPFYMYIDTQTFTHKLTWLCLQCAAKDNGKKKQRNYTSVCVCEGE